MDPAPNQLPLLIAGHAATTCDQTKRRLNAPLYKRTDREYSLGDREFDHSILLCFVGLHCAPRGKAVTLYSAIIGTRRAIRRVVQ